MLRLPGWTAEAAVPSVFPGRGGGRSCGLLWLLCTVFQDAWACSLYARLPACNPCVPGCDPECKPAPGQPAGIGYRDCIDSHCQRYQILCPR